MSFRHPFPNANSTFRSHNINYNLGNTCIVPQTDTDAFQRSVRTDSQNCQDANFLEMNKYQLSTPSSLSVTRNVNATVCDNNINNPKSREQHVYNNAPLPRLPIIAPPLSHSNLLNTRPQNLNLPSQTSNVNPSFHMFQSYNRNAPPAVVNHANFNFEPRNMPIQRFPPPMPNIACSSLLPSINCPRFQNNARVSSPGNIPTSLSSLPQFPLPVIHNTTSVVNSTASYSVGNVPNSVPQPVVYTSPVTVRPPMINSSQNSSISPQTNSAVQMPLQLPLNNTYKPQNLNIPSNPSIYDKEIKVAAFLAKFSAQKKENKHQVTIPEFRYVIKAVIRLLKLLDERKSKLSKLLDASEREWKSEAENAVNDQEELSALCSFISSPDSLNHIMEKLKLIKKRRERKKKTNQNKLSEKMRAEQKRKERDQEIDKWLDDIKEKNQKTKREAELKKEADYILLEVRRKIYEANKTIEKIKVFEKLRSARQSNATQKGLHVLSMHNLKFEKKMSILKETMIKQLADYEAEEKALKVMLETEQEGQREEETQWKIKKMKTLQQKKQNHTMECLFGISDDPLPTDPLYLFYKYHTSGSSSIETLVQIRKQWDIHISEDGDVIPQHWVVPVAPSNASWEQCLVTSKN